MKAFAFGDTIYGWTIDDISITGVAAGGTINITKNLGQGTWSLFSLSPIGLVPVQSDVTPSVTISNLAAGQYVVQFGDVTLLSNSRQPDQHAGRRRHAELHRQLHVPRRESQRHFRRVGKVLLWGCQHQPVTNHGCEWNVGLRKFHRRHQSHQRGFQIYFPFRRRPDQSMRPIAMGDHSRPAVSSGRLNRSRPLDAAHRLASSLGEPHVLYWNQRRLRLAVFPGAGSAVKWPVSTSVPAAAFQYRGTLRSISSDHAVMPPLTLLTYLKPCCRRKFSAFSERTPALQCK